MADVKRKSTSGKITGTPLLISVALALIGGSYSLISDAPRASAQSGNGAALANLRGQIQRYGCNLPQYANSVAGCRALKAKVRSLESGGASPGARKISSNPTRYGSARRTPRPAPPPSSSGGGFFSSLFGGGGSKRSRSASRYNSYGMSRPGNSASGQNSWSSTYPSYMRGYGRYRTLCVRTCDGYYWPVSFSTTRSGIARDANQCASSCQVPAKLFYHRNPGADVQNMVDIRGKPYVNTQNAFRYRKEYVKNCRCKPEPWSEAAKQVYKQRGEQDENPGQVTVAQNVPTGDSPPAGTSNGDAYPAATPHRGAYPKPRPRRQPRTKYIADDPALSGRWWAGSW